MIEQQQLLVVCALAARCFGVAVCLPLGDALQALPRLCVAIAWGLALLGAVPAMAELSALSCLWEFAVGVLLAVPLRLVSDSAEMFGELVDTARGQTISSVIDPLGGQGASDLAALCRVAAVAAAVHMGALELSVRELAASYQFFPLGAPWRGVWHATDLFGWSTALVGGVLALSSIWLAAFLMVDVVAAAAARLVRGLQFSLAGSTAKALLAFLLLRVVVEVAQEIPSHALARFGSHFGGEQSPGAEPPASTGLGQIPAED